MLVRTPQPHASESLAGYLLRISDANGYDTVNHVLHTAGITRIEGLISLTFCHSIAPILGAEPANLLHMAYTRLLPGGKRDFVVLGQSVGPRRSPHPLRVTRPQLCVACIEENGFIDAFWDLSFACACPTHRTYALEHCVSCKRKLKISRPGLLTCACRTPLTHSDSEKASETVTEFMSILMAKVHQSETAHLPNVSGFPMESLRRLSLSTLVVLIPLLGRFALGALGERPEAKALTVAAAETLARWPTNFHLMLHRQDQRLAEQKMPFGLRKRFDKFYNAMFTRRAESADFEFLRKAFINFGLNEWGDGVVDGKLLAKVTSPGRFVSQATLAKQQGVRRVTIRRWAERELVELKTIRFGNQVRYVADTHALQPVPHVSGRRFEQREAAALLGMPVAVLRDIRKTEHYPALHMARQKPGYDEGDLKLLIKKMHALCDSIDSSHVDVDHHFSLGYALREIRFWLKDGKSRFVFDFLAGTVKSVGRTGESADEIWFLKSDVNEYAEACRLAASTVTISRPMAAATLVCNEGAIASLLRQGHLEIGKGRGHVKVSRESVSRFVLNYISTLEIARDASTSVRRMNYICNRADVIAIRFNNTADRESCFIRRSDLHLVRAAIARHPVGSSLGQKNAP